MAYNIIFDIDQTIVDSSSAEGFRNSRNWAAALHEIDAGNVKPFTGMVELIKEARSYGHDIAFVSTSPDSYCRKIFQKIGLDPNDYCGFIPYSQELYRGNKTAMYQAALKGFSNDYQPLVIVGDSEGDISSASVLQYPYRIFTIRCLWGLSDSKIERDLEGDRHPDATIPYMIMKEVSELRDFLFYRWSVRTDENGVAYAFNYFPTGSGRFHDIFSEYFQRDIKGYEVYVVPKPVFIRKWAIQYIISYIEDTMRDLQLTNAWQIGIMIVPSSTEGRWNNALEEILKEVVRLKGVTDCAHFMIRHTGREAAHNANDRSVDTNVNTMRISEPETLRWLSALIILDDITTSGSTYEACDIVIKRDAGDVFDGVIRHVALAKTKNLHYEGNRNNTCEARQIGQMSPPVRYVRRADTYFAVNSDYEFSRIYHRNSRCVRDGVKWGFVGIEGIRYYLPLDCQLCERCGSGNIASVIAYDPEDDDDPPF